MRAPKIIAPAHIWEEWKAYERMSAPNEVQAFGVGAPETHEGRIVGVRIEHLYLPRQEVSPAAAESDSAATREAFLALRALMPDGIVWWVHSHVDMDVGWSGTDHASLDARAKEAGGDPVFATVTNRRGESHSSVVVEAFGVPVIGAADLVLEPYGPRREWVEAFRARVAERPAPEYHARVVGFQRGVTVVGKTTPEEAMRYLRMSYSGDGENPAAVKRDWEGKQHAFRKSVRKAGRRLVEAGIRAYPSTREGGLAFRASLVERLESLLGMVETETDFDTTGDDNDHETINLEAATWADEMMGGD